MTTVLSPLHTQASLNINIRGEDGLSNLNFRKIEAIFASTLAAVETIHKHKYISDLCTLSDERAQKDSAYDPRADADLLGNEDAETKAYVWANHNYSYTATPLSLEERFYTQIHAIAYEISMFSDSIRTQYMVHIASRIYTEIPHLRLALWLFTALYFDPRTSPELIEFSNYIVDTHLFSVGFYIPIQGSYERSAIEEISVFGVANAMRKLKRLGTRFSNFVYNYYLDTDTVPQVTSVWCPCPCNSCHASWLTMHKKLHPTCKHMCCAKLPDPFITLTVDGEEKECVTADRLEMYRVCFEALPRNSGMISEENDEKENDEKEN